MKQSLALLVLTAQLGAVPGVTGVTKLYDEARDAEVHAAADPFEGLTRITIEQDPAGFATTSYEDRDRRRILNPESQLIGSLTELEDQIYLTRLGLYRRADAKFNEFVAQPMGDPKDGYGLWRRWESREFCPLDLLIADPWGSISWEEQIWAPLQRRIKCSWVVRPGMYRRGGYMVISRSPVTVSFREFHLATELEFLEIYDGVGSGATLLGRFTGSRTPGQLSSTAPEMRIVYHANMNRTTAQLWDDVEDAVRSGQLHVALSKFALAARFGVRGFMGQDVRAAIRAIAIRASHAPENAWMRRKWFMQDERRFNFEIDAAIASVSQDVNMWAKRSRHDPGKEHEPWERVYGPRRFPMPIYQPGQNPLYGQKNTQPNQADSEARRLVGFTGASETAEVASLFPVVPSGFLLDFVSIADCSGRGITSSGRQMFPPLTVSSTPEENFELLDFPIELSSCQPMEISGMQRTRDRPFTISDKVRKAMQEDILKACTNSSQCSRDVLPPSPPSPTPIFSSPDVLETNCSKSCSTLFACIDAELATRSSWEVSGERQRYNKSLVSAARQKCHMIFYDEDPSVKVDNCINLMENFRTQQDPKQSSCLNLGCFTCGVDLYKSYFDCARRCTEVCAQTHAPPSI